MNREQPDNDAADDLRTRQMAPHARDASSPLDLRTVRDPRPPAGWFRQQRTETLGLLAGGGVLLSVVFVLLAIGAARGCSSAGKLTAMEARLVAVENELDGGGGSPHDALGAPGASAANPGKAGLPPPPDPSAAAARASADPACSLARAGAYQAWDEAVAKAKAGAPAREAPCANARGDRKRQGCYYAAGAVVRTSTAARDAAMHGGTAAREAVRNVKDDGSVEAIAKARTASEAAFTQCHDAD